MDQLLNDLTFPNPGNYGRTVDFERLRACSHAGFCRSTVAGQKIPKTRGMRAQALNRTGNPINYRTIGCRIIAIWAVCKGLGIFLCILLGFR